MGYIILLVFLYLIFSDKIKPEDTYTDDNVILVNCPYCNGSLSIEHEGTWSCIDCNNIFIYRDFTTYTSDEVCSDSVLDMVTLIAKVSRADGAVTKNEINILDEFLVDVIELNINQRKEAASKFNYEKQNYHDYEKTIVSLYRLFNDNQDVLNGIVEVISKISYVDGGIHREQEKIINMTLDIFGIPRNNYNNSKNKYNNELEDHYKVINCTQESSIEEIKRNYRKLINEFHPDKYVSKDLPESMMILAKEKTQEIQNAYEKIKKVKNFN